jgi:predicted transposase YdaD
MTIADRIREEERTNLIKGLLQNGVSIELISKYLGLSIQKLKR